jgi:hypothetical protein
MTMSVSGLYIASDDRMINGYGAVGGITVSPTKYIQVM